MANERLGHAHSRLGHASLPCAPPARLAPGSARLLEALPRSLKGPRPSEPSPPHVPLVSR